MIHHIKGTIIEKNPAYVILETAGGVGYYIHISLNTFSQLKDEQQVTLLTHYVVKEDAQLLYGFHSEDERSLFRLLIGVNGIGPNTACLILSALSVQDVVNAIASQDLRTIQSVKGIGAKTAQRVVMELKDKVAKGSFGVQDNFSSSYNNNKMEALSALVALGFAKNLAEKVLDGIVKSEGSELTVEELIKKALKLL
jgi:Holliday junction DNA helicase RuvA